MGVGELGPRGRQEQERTGGPREEALQHVEEVILGPVQVLDDEDRRPGGGVRRGEPWPRTGKFVGDGPGLHPVEGIVREEQSRRERQREHRLLDVLARQAEASKEGTDCRSELLPGHVRRVVQHDPCGPAEDLAQRPVRDPMADGQAASAEDRQLRVPSGSGPKELLDQPALADPCRSGNPHQPGSSRLGRLGEEGHERVQLAVAAHHLGAEARDAPGHFGQRLDQTPRGDRIGLALQLQVGGRFEPEGVPCGEVRAFPSQDGARFSGLLQSRRDVHRIARDDHLLDRTSDGRDDVSGVDPDPDLHRDPMALLEVAVQVLQPGEHVEPRVEGSLGIVFPDDRHAEDGHDGVADELLDRPPPGLDHRRHGREVGREEDSKPFRVQALAERGRTRHVGEQHCDELPLFLSGRPAGGERGPTGGTEPSRRSHRGAAGRAGTGQRGATRRAEGGRLENLGATRRAGPHGPLWSDAPCAPHAFQQVPAATAPRIVLGMTGARGDDRYRWGSATGDVRSWRSWSFVDTGPERPGASP